MKSSIKNKRGITLVQTVVYVFFLLFIISLSSGIMIDMTQRSGHLANQELFYSQKDSLYYRLQETMTTVKPKSVIIEPSVKGKGNKLSYVSGESKYQLIQQKEGGLVLKITTPHDSTDRKDITSFTYKNISNTEINPMNKVCYGDTQPDFCVDVTNLFEIIVSSEKRILSRGNKLESRRVFYYAR